MEILKAVVFASVSAVSLFVMSRLIGQRQIAQMSFFDYVNGITVGSIAAELAICGGEGWLPMLVAMAVWAAFSYFGDLLANKFIGIHRALVGEAKILYENGTLYERELAGAKIDINEFLSAARSAGYFDLSTLQAAVLETNGSISFLPTAENSPVTVKDMGLTPSGAAVLSNVIIDGEIMEGPLTELGFDKQWLKKQLANRGYRENEVLLATLDKSGKLCCYEKDGGKTARHPFM